MKEDKIQPSNKYPELSGTFMKMSLLTYIQQERQIMFHLVYFCFIMMLMRNAFSRPIIRNSLLTTVDNNLLVILYKLHFRKENQKGLTLLKAETSP